MSGRNRKQAPGGRGMPRWRQRHRLGRSLPRDDGCCWSGSNRDGCCRSARSSAKSSPTTRPASSISAGAYSDWLEIYNPDPQAAYTLTNWSINYAKTGATWTFPNNVTIGPGEYRVIFCDSTPTTDPLGELHTSFNLSKSGSTLELINATNSVVSSLTYPAMSVGHLLRHGRDGHRNGPRGRGATAAYYAPTNGNLVTTGNGANNWTLPTYNDSTWYSGATGLGFAGNVNGFATTVYKSNLPQHHQSHHGELRHKHAGRPDLDADRDCALHQLHQHALGQRRLQRPTTRPRGRASPTGPSRA